MKAWNAYGYCRFVWPPSWLVMMRSFMSLSISDSAHPFYSHFPRPIFISIRHSPIQFADMIWHTPTRAHIAHSVSCNFFSLIRRLINSYRPAIEIDSPMNNLSKNTWKNSISNNFHFCSAILLLCSLYVFQNKPVAVDPIDFESFISKNKTLIQNDPQRELLLISTDDVSVSP